MRPKKANIQVQATKGSGGRRYAHIGYVTGCEKKQHARLDSKSLRVEHTQNE